MGCAAAAAAAAAAVAATSAATATEVRADASIVSGVCGPVDVIPASEPNAQSHKHTKQHGRRRLRQVPLQMVGLLHQMLNDDRNNNQSGEDEQVLGGYNVWIVVPCTSFEAIDFVCLGTAMNGGGSHFP